MSKKKPEPDSLNTWKVSVNDGYTTWTFEIIGRDDASIEDVAKAAKRYLRGKIVRKWNSRKLTLPAFCGTARPPVVRA